MWLIESRFIVATRNNVSRIKKRPADHLFQRNTEVFHLEGLNKYRVPMIGWQYWQTEDDKTNVDLKSIVFGSGT